MLFGYARLLEAYYSLLEAYYSLLEAYNSLLEAYYSLLEAYYSLFYSHCCVLLHKYTPLSRPWRTTTVCCVHCTVALYW